MESQLKQSTSFQDYDDMKETFMGNPEAVNAVTALESEIAAVEARFKAGELNSFGKSEELVLQRFQELRRRQVDLSRKQVELLSSKKTKGRFGAGPGGLDELTSEMQKLCGMIEDVERLTMQGLEGSDEEHAPSNDGGSEESASDQDE